MTGARALDRAALRDLLLAWQHGETDGATVKRHAEQSLHGGAIAPAELLPTLHQLDLLDVQLLTPRDAPALIALLDTGDEIAFAAYRDALDLDARSRTLRRDPFYRPFCR